ncbi:MAG TPA: hypothetical protein VIL33_00075, partial [Rhodothermia bacterium]
QIMPPIAHLETPDDHVTDPALTVELWDEHATAVPSALRLGGHRNVSPEVESRHSGKRFFVNTHQSTTLCLDRDAGRIVGFSRRADNLSLYERGRPLHMALTQWHNDLEIPVVHAALVSKGGKGVLFAGPAGVGKSTCAVACLCAGFNYLSDDLIALEEVRDDSFRGHSLYSSTYFEAGHLRRFPTLAPHATGGRRSGEDKLLVLLHAVLPSRIMRTARIHAVVLPEISYEERSTIRSASPAKALLALAPQSLSINRELGRVGFEKLSRLVERVPSFHLLLGRDLEQVVSTVEQIVIEIS